MVASFEAAGGEGRKSWDESRVTRRTFARQPLDTVVKRYDRYAPWYRYLEWTILLAPGFRRRAIERIGLQRGERVLEVGCGTGRNLALLRDGVGDAGQVIGIDASPGMLAEARKVVAHGGWDNVVVGQRGRGHADAG